MPGTFRPEVLEIVQVGVEASNAYATTVPAIKRLGSVGVDLDPKIPTTKVMAQGSKSPVGIVVAKEHTEIAIKGEAAINDLCYLFGMLLSTPGVTTVGPTANLYEYLPDTHNADTFTSLTLERGSTSGAARVAGVLCDELSLSLVPEKSVSFTGKLLGKERVGGITLTANPTRVPLIPLDPRGVSIYVADSEANLPTGQIKPLEASWNVKNRHTAVFTLDAAEHSFEDTAERPFEPMGQLVVRANTASDAYLDNLRAADLLFVQYVWTGAAIDVGIPYKLEITMPFRFENPKEGPKSDVHTQTLDLCGQDDDTFGGSCRVRIWTPLASL